ncbi:MAG: hypothetical protein PHE53_07665 [Thermoguttaceae bacterium]|nr:hypothetical protein [Thermoguttaceae bacterium]
MRYKWITLTPPTADLSDQLVRVKIDSDPAMGAVCSANGYDVYFTTSDGSTQLPFSRLEWSITDAAASGVFDVLCDIPVSGLTIRVYYGGVSSTDRQNRAVTYAGYLAVYPLNAIPTTVLTDISGNGKNITARSDGVWSQYDHATYGKLLTTTLVTGNLTPTVYLGYAGAVTVSAIAEGISGNALFPSFFDRGYFAGRTAIKSADTQTVFHTVASGTDTSSVSVSGKAGYIGYTVPTSGTGPDCTLRINNQKTVGVTTSSFVRYNTFCVFGGYAGYAGTMGMRDLRVKKGTITAASATWEYANLATTSSTLSFSTEQHVSRRRHPQILEAF